MKIFGKSNTTTFVFNDKKIVLTSSPPNCQSESQRNALVTNKKSTKPLQLLYMIHIIEPIPHVEFRSTNPTITLPTPLGSYAYHLYKLREKIHRQIVFGNDTYRSTADYHAIMHEFSNGDKVTIKAHPERFPPGIVENLLARYTCPCKVPWEIGSNAYEFEFSKALSISPACD